MNIQKADNTTMLHLPPNLSIFIILVLSLRGHKKLTMAKGTCMSRMKTTTKGNTDVIHELKVGQIKLQGQIAALMDMVKELLTNGKPTRGLPSREKDRGKRSIPRIER